MNMEEYVPIMTPMSSASAKYFIDKPPKRYIASSVITTVSEVLIERTRVSLSTYLLRPKSLLYSTP